MRIPNLPVIRAVNEFGTTIKVAIIPAAEHPARDAQLLQRPACRQVRLFDERDNLELFGCAIPHSSSSPSARMLLKQTVLKRQFGDAFLQGAGLAAQILDFVGRGR